MALKHSTHEKNCHPKSTILDQNRTEINILYFNGVKYQILNGKIIISRYIHPRNDSLPKVPCLFLPLNIFFTLLALKPGSDLQPCHKCFSSGVHSLGLSDHNFIYITCKNKRIKGSPRNSHSMKIIILIV